ncbi:hypothetical protein N0V93_003776 [Gnomoniopsis smithogilvyi]|uniref:Uncharacterized protein n=1 Tax=Gnomoniopsis smithogilvyi TaxID=1191159 RepID=A0A9W9D062_9PEZI|nr:hypothetical protein N0V93_003776 [Gnomoniopsis smithogilvyi]
MPTTIREESEGPAEDSEKPQEAASDSNDAPPQIPVELNFPVEASSSFERALDAVIFKLDAMEERRRSFSKSVLHKVKLKFERARFTASNFLEIKTHPSLFQCPAEFEEMLRKLVDCKLSSNA